MYYKYTFLERDLHKKQIGYVKFWQKITIFEKITENMFFFNFLFKIS